jgi:hypothetical protein
MPTYEISIPNKGTFEVSSDKDLTDAQAYQYALQQSQAEPKTSIGQDLARQVGLFGRAAVTGATAIPLMAGDALNSLLNLGFGREVFKPSSKSMQDIMTTFGVPEPKTPTERVIQDITGAVAGVAAPAALATKVAPLLQQFKYGPSAQEFFATSVPAQTVAATGGALGGGLAKEGDMGVGGQLGFGLLGAMVPSAATSLAPAAARGAMELVRPMTEAGRQTIAGKVLSSLAREPQTAMKQMEGFQPSVSGYTPTTAQASRDIGLVGAESPIKALDVTSKFATQASEANQARMAILDRMAKDDAALKQAIDKRNEVTAPLRENAFNNSTASPEQIQSAVSLVVDRNINDILASPEGKRGTVIKAMDFARNTVGRADDVRSLYEVRKDLRDAAQGLLDKEGPQYSLAKKQLETIIRSVDDVIDSAAPGYKDYLNKYSQASKGIESMQGMQDFKTKVLTTTPDPSRVGDYFISQPAFTRTLRSLEQDNTLNLSGAQLSALKKISADLDSGVLPRATKSPGSDTFKNISTANVIGGIIGKQTFGDMPATLSKVAAPLNWLYNGTDDQIRELLVDAMLDPKLAFKLMSKASTTNVEPLSRELQRKAIAAGYGATFGLR